MTVQKEDKLDKKWLECRIAHLTKLVFEETLYVVLDLLGFNSVYTSKLYTLSLAGTHLRLMRRVSHRPEVVPYTLETIPRLSRDRNFKILLNHE